MTTRELFVLLEQPQKLRLDVVLDLEQIIKKYPFFQSARALLIKGLKEEKSFKYNQELKQTVAHTMDRAVLFDWITSKKFDSKSQQPTWKQSKEPISDFGKRIVQLEQSLDNAQQQPTTKSVDLETDVPLNFTKSDTYSFAQWVKLTTISPLDRDANEDFGQDLQSIPNHAISVTSSDKVLEDKKSKATKNTHQFNRIDRFISSNPKIPKGHKSVVPLGNLAEKKDFAPEELMTETLARVYVSQKKYQKAIQAYKILILKYPEKSGFFVDQINAINSLKDSK